MSAITCPLPELADALQPYIRSKEEVASIRHSLDMALNKQQAGSNRPLTRYLAAEHAQLREPSELDVLDGRGTRSTYARAMSARRNASQRLTDLRDELARLHKPTASAEPASHADGTLLALASLRREQRRQILEIVKNSVRGLEEERERSEHGNLSHILNNERQALPVPPSITPSKEFSRQNNTSSILELKKAVLKAKSLVDTDPAVLNDSDPHDWPEYTHNGPRVLALIRTRDEMVKWLENELSKMSQGGEFAMAGAASPSLAENEEVEEANIHDVYSKYLEVRQDLVRVLAPLKESIVTSKPLSRRPSQERQYSASGTMNPKQHEQPASCPASDILPYAKELCAITEQEAALIQHSTFLRRQLAWTSDRTGQLLYRLADESHLLVPGASDTFAWVQAAAHVREDDAQTVGARLLASENSLCEAREAVL